MCTFWETMDTVEFLEDVPVTTKGVWGTCQPPILSQHPTILDNFQTILAEYRTSAAEVRRRDDKAFTIGVSPSKIRDI